MSMIDKEIYPRILIAWNWLRHGFYYLGAVIRFLSGALFLVGFNIFIIDLLDSDEAIEEYCNRVDCYTYPMDEVFDEMFRDADIMWAVLTPILTWFYFSIPLILYLFVAWCFSGFKFSSDERKEFIELVKEVKEFRSKEKESKS